MDTDLRYIIYALYQEISSFLDSLKSNDDFPIIKKVCQKKKKKKKKPSAAY